MSKRNGYGVFIAIVGPAPVTGQESIAFLLTPDVFLPYCAAQGGTGNAGMGSQG